MMININDIMDMLDWGNTPEVQAEGRRLAADVKCLSIFIQPLDRSYFKNVWENCALILSEKEDELLRPYIVDLLAWLQDLTWPGSLIILDRLKEFKNYAWLARDIGICTEIAVALGKKMWLKSMAELLDNKSLFNHLSDSTKDILVKWMED